MSGFYVMKRGWRDHPVFKGEFSRGDAWGWLIENACWRETMVKVGGQYVELQRGELSFSVRFMAEKWDWSKSRVDRFLNELNALGMIETRSKIGTVCDKKSGHGQTVITICNYAKYQDVGKGQRDKVGTVSGTKLGQQRDKEEPLNHLTIEANASNQRRARASALPKGWTPVLTPAMTELVSKWPKGEFEEQVENFRDHAAANGRTAKDWQAAFRTWARRADKWRQRDAGHKGNSEQRSNREAAEHNPILRAVIAKREAREAGDEHREPSGGAEYGEGAW